MKKPNATRKFRRAMGSNYKKYNIAVSILKNQQLDGAPKIILYFGGTNIIFAN